MWRDDDTYARLNGDVFETIVRALELSISERLDSAPLSTSTIVIRTRRRNSVCPEMFSLCRRIWRRGIRYETHGGAKGVAEIYLTRISRERATVIACEPGLGLRARDINGIFVLTLSVLARSFVRGDCLPGTIDSSERWEETPPHTLSTSFIHLGSLSRRKEGRKSNYIWRSVRALSIYTAEEIEIRETWFRPNRSSCSCPSGRCACKYACKWPR